jgi:hypothetical protein
VRRPEPEDQMTWGWLAPGLACRVKAPGPEEKAAEENARGWAACWSCTSWPLGPSWTAPAPCRIPCPPWKRPCGGVAGGAGEGTGCGVQGAR